MTSIDVKMHLSMQYVNLVYVEQKDLRVGFGEEEMPVLGSLQSMHLHHHNGF